MIRDPDLDFLSIPDPEVKKAPIPEPDPQHCPQVYAYKRQLGNPRAVQAASVLYSVQYIT
jgi:hypothetical protein